MKQGATAWSATVPRDTWDPCMLPSKASSWKHRRGAGQQPRGHAPGAAAAGSKDAKETELPKAMAILGRLRFQQRRQDLSHEVDADLWASIQERITKQDGVVQALRREAEEKLEPTEWAARCEQRLRAAREACESWQSDVERAQDKFNEAK